MAYSERGYPYPDGDSAIDPARVDTGQPGGSGAITARVAVFSQDASTLRVLMVERGADRFPGCWALPGGCVGVGQDVLRAAGCGLALETGLSFETLEYVGAYTDLNARRTAFAYTIWAHGTPHPTSGAGVRWIHVAQLRNGTRPAALGHLRIIHDAVAVIRARGYGPA